MRIGAANEAIPLQGASRAVGAARPPPPSVNYYACVQAVAAPLMTTHVLAVDFFVLALLGALWPVVARLAWRPREPCVRAL